MQACDDELPLAWLLVPGAPRLSRAGSAGSSDGARCQLTLLGCPQLGRAGTTFHSQTVARGEDVYGCCGAPPALCGGFLV